MNEEEILKILKGNITVVKDDKGNITFKIDNANLKPYEKEKILGWLIR